MDLFKKWAQMSPKLMILLGTFLLIGCSSRNYDTTPPTIKCNNDVVVVDSEFNPNDYCVVRDDRSKTIKIAMDGELDTTQPGRYTVTLTAVDEAGNIGVKTQSFLVGGNDGVIFFRTDKDNDLDATYKACVAEGKKRESFECAPIMENGEYVGYQLSY